MKVNYGIVKGADKTPASEMNEYVLKHATALMLVGGIKSLSAAQYVSGIGHRLHVTAGFVDGAPKAVVAVGMIMKDAIAQILATANFNAVEIQLQDEDIAKVRSNWAEWKDGEPVNGNENNGAQDKGGCKCGKCGGGQEEAIVPEVV